MEQDAELGTATLEWWDLTGFFQGRHVTYPLGLNADRRGADLAEVFEDFSRWQDDDLNPPGSPGDHVEFMQSVWCLRGWWDQMWRWPRRRQLVGRIAEARHDGGDAA